jgi:NAD(P)-dependent dehydrogenase (short-subunit alcohol dehydrogenase family)
MTEQVWFITGSSRGLGRSVAEEALAAGRKVVATARRTSTGGSSALPGRRTSPGGPAWARQAAAGWPGPRCEYRVLKAVTA